MNKPDLYIKADAIAEQIGKETLLDNLMMSMSQDDLEDCLRYIDTAFETDVFDD